MAEITDRGYRALAAEVARTATLDLKAAYKKVRGGEEKDKKGTLREFVTSITMRGKGLSAITLTTYDATAVIFFKDGSRQKDLMLSILGMDEGSLPRKIVEQRDFVLQNARALTVKIEDLPF